MKIAIIGGNLSGAYTSYLLSQKGFDVTVYDHKIPFEKPCGGGVSYHTFKEFPFLQALDLPKKKIERVEFISHRDLNWEMSLNDPLHICSREDISKHILKMTIEAGTKFVAQKVCSIKDNGRGYTLTNQSHESEDFDFIIGADGARSSVRREVMGSFPKEYYSMTMGYFVPHSMMDKIVLKFHSDIKGYIWVFPRVDHTSIGVGSLVNSISMSELKKILDDFIQKEYPDLDLSQAKKYSAFIPSLPGPYIKKLKCSSKHWALIGDAGGFADPTTGEGIYYALKSAEILADCLINDKLHEYDNTWKKTFGWELVKSSSLSTLFYKPTFTESMILIAAKSQPLQDVLSDLITAQQSYLTLKERLMSQLLSCSKDVIFNTDFRLKKNLFDNLKYVCSNW